MDNSRFISLLLVHLTALIGILSLWNVAESFYFFIFLAIYLLGIYMDFKGFYPIRRVFLTLFGFILSLSFWKIFKTLVDYEVSKLEGKIEKSEKKEKVKKIEVE